jgi:hypothetical protein
MVLSEKMKNIYLNKIIEIVNNPDSYYGGQTESTEDLDTFIKELGINLTPLPDDIEERKRIIRLRVRVWASIEALKLIDELSRNS